MRTRANHLQVDQAGILVGGWLDQVNETAHRRLKSAADSYRLERPFLLRGPAELAFDREIKYGYKAEVQARTIDALVASAGPPLQAFDYKQTGYPKIDWYKVYPVLDGAEGAELVLVTGTAKEFLSVEKRVLRCLAFLSPLRDTIPYAAVFESVAPDETQVTSSLGSHDAFLAALEPIVYAAQPQVDERGRVFIGDQKILP